MNKNFINVLKTINFNKKYKYILIVTIMLLFISIIGYSLSFSLTTNSGELDDMVLKLTANNSEVFNVNILSLNSGDVNKYNSY